MTKADKNNSCGAAREVHTIGHSTRSIETFVELLGAHRIELLIDVRRWPMSKRHPQFHREDLAASLSRMGIAYHWRGDLGGFRKPAANSMNSAWQVGAFRAYADFMLTAEFDNIINELEKFVGVKRATFMCAEAVPWQCHRQLLADAFFVRGWKVRHIFDDRCREHKLPAFARPQGMKIYYPGLV